ncbi:MAG: hypothetical protein ACYC2H_01970 [Thermoplasmatota archaeon]
MTAVCEVEERTVRFTPHNAEALAAVMEGLARRGASPAIQVMSTSAAATEPTPQDEPIPALPAGDKGLPHVGPHVRLYPIGDRLKVNAKELAPMQRLHAVFGKDLVGGTWHTTPNIVAAITNDLIVRPRRVRKGDGYYLVRRSMQTRMVDVCMRLAAQCLQVQVRPSRTCADNEYRVVYSEHAVPRIQKWRGD